MDDASTDATAALAAHHGAQVVPVTHRQIAAARNSGALQATGDVLIFVDADTSLTEAVVRAAIRAMREGAVGGGAVVRFDGRIPLYARVLLRLGGWLQRHIRLASGCFLFSSRQAFDAVGGFDATLYAFEDIAMSRALKRLGRFVVLQETVTTSGRNLRAHSGLDALRMLGGLALHGSRFFRTRRGLRFWYGERRDDPDTSA